MIVYETGRLRVRRIELSDALFIEGLLNQPSFLRFIGDRGVRSREDAERYIGDGPQASYERHGFGLWLVVRRDLEEPIGMCGLLRRETLPEPDLGFAYVPSAWGLGFGREAARGALDHARDVVGLRRLLAITSPDNERSGHLLESVGFRRGGLVRLAPGAEELRLYDCDLATDLS